MSSIKIRKADVNDCQIYFNWINDSEVRNQSFYSDIVSWDKHQEWFSSKIIDNNYCFYLFYISEGDFIGQVRFQKIDFESALISVSVPIEHRGKKFGEKIIKLACQEYFKNNPTYIIQAFIKKQNISSKRIFERAGFVFLKEVDFNNYASYHYTLKCK